MRHRAPRHLPAVLRLHRVRPRRRLARLATRWHASTWLPSRPSTRLASALAAMLLLLSGGALAVGALDDGTVPAVDEAPPDRSFVPSTSRSTDRPTLSSSPHDKGTPEPVTATPEEETTSHARAPAPGTPTVDPSPRESSPPVRAPVVPPTGETPSLPTQAQSDPPNLPTHSSRQTAGQDTDAPTVTVDRTAPSTVLDSMPERHDDSATAGFSFHADEDASFTCSLDGGAFRPCGSGTGYAVQPGWHDFAVRATDRSGNVDASPAQWHWQTSARD